jgi:AraC-like DNA-binding protein
MLRRSPFLCDSPGVMVDPLSDILTMANAESVITGRLLAGGRWAIHFPAPEQVKLYAVVRGGCWVLREGERQPERFEHGDVVLITERRAFVLASDVSAPPRDARALFRQAPDRTVRLGEPPDFELLGGHVTVDPSRGRTLLEALPPRIRLHGGSPAAASAQLLLGQLAAELGADQAGKRVASMLLTQLVFVLVLRSHLASASPTGTGWLRALADDRLAPALRLMHGDPARDWPLAELARAAGMSRTTFAERFKASAGVAPFAYLVHWRMRLAERALREQDVTIAALAESLGYSSESAFSSAFKRVTGVPPRRFRVESRSAPDG